MPKPNKKSVSEFRRKVKKMSVVYKGGECLVCGYDYCISALIFHHLNPETKKFPVSSGNTRAWLKTKSEVDKCVLLCKNCHAEVHQGILDLNPHLHNDPPPETGNKLLKKEGYDPHLSRSNPEHNKENTCLDCGDTITQYAKRCRSCAAKHNATTKIDWPPTQELIESVRRKNFSAVARDLGVSGNGIRKRIRKKSNVKPKDLT